MLGYSTSLKEVVGKYFTKKTTDLVPQRFKKAAELVALDNIDQALYDFGIDDTGVFDVAQIDKIVDEQIAEAEDFWGLVGPWFKEFDERVPKRIAQQSFNDGFIGLNTRQYTIHNKNYYIVGVTYYDLPLAGMTCWYPD